MRHVERNSTGAEGCCGRLEFLAAPRDHRRVGRLVRKSDQSSHHLASEVFVGRSRAADLRIDAPYVSGLHASVHWSGDGWMLRDMGSRNGTRVNGDPVELGDLRRLEAGDQIRFGDERQTWVLVSTDPPLPFASSGGELTVAEDDDVLALPNAEHAQVSVVFDPEQGWLREDLGSDGEASLQPVADRDIVLADGRAWVVRLPNLLASTRGVRPWTIDGAKLRVIGGGEALTVEVHQNERTQSFRLLSPAPLFCLLAEARVRGDGWIDREHAFEALRINLNHLNVQVFRLRRAFSRAGFLDARRVVERERTRLRLGVAEVELLSLDDGDGR